MYQGTNVGRKSHQELKNSTGKETLTEDEEL